MPRSEARFLSDLEENLTGSPPINYASIVVPQIIQDDRRSSDGSHQQDAEFEVYTRGNEAIADQRFPAARRYSLPAVLIYRFTSMTISPIFLSGILTCALLKPIPSFFSNLWSCSWSFRNRRGGEIEHQQGQENQLHGTDTLKCDISYYAQLVGLNCEETKIETEDGFILTVQHIIDRRPDSVHWKRTNPNDLMY
jgi:hypothetical protein